MRARDEQPERDAGDGSNQAGHGALAEEEPADLAARRAERAQDANLGPALRHGDRERVVDDEHADEEREQARDVHHDRVGGGHRLELLPAPRRRIHLEPRPEQPAQLRLRLRDRPPRLQREVDAVERAPAAEHPLRRVDVHHREVPAERARQTARRHDPAHGERPLAERRAERDRPVHLEAVLLGELPRHHERVGLREEDERIVDHRLVGVLDVVLAQAAIAGHVDAEDQQLALAADPGVHHRLDHGHGHAHGRGRLHGLQHFLVEPGLARRDLQLGLAGDAVDGLVEGVQHALVGRVHADEHRHPQHDPGHRQHRPQDVLAEVRPADEAQEDHASASRPRRGGRRAARLFVDSCRPPSCRG